MELKYIKAHCVKKNKWFGIEVNGDTNEIVNFDVLSADAAATIGTELSGTAFHVCEDLRACCKCGSRDAGTCVHIDGLGLCDIPYSYQCLFCNQMRINRTEAKGRFSDYVGQSNIAGAAKDRFGNPKGSDYDLARDGGFSGFKVVILCLYTGENILNGIQQPIKAMEKKGFSVKLTTRESADDLRAMLRDACQFWLLSDRIRHLDDDHLKVIRDFYEAGHGVYIFGDNDPFYADANFVAEKLLGTSMHGNTEGDKVIGVQSANGGTGIIPGHPITTGIVNLYEGITIATVRTTSTVKPLVISSDRNVVTAIVDQDGKRAMLDGGFTRLFHKWDTAGTDRFIVNCAAWLANDDGTREEPFTKMGR